MKMAELKSKHAATMKIEPFYFDYKSLAEQNVVQSGPYIVNTAGHPTANCLL